MAINHDPDYLTGMIKPTPESAILQYGRRLAAASLLAIAFALPASAAWAQDTVAVRGQLFDDYGRLTLNWPKASPKVDIGLTRETMTLRFERPVSLDPIALRANLKAYIRGATLSSDAKTLSLALKKPVTYRVNQVGARLQLDFAQPGEAVFPNKANVAPGIAAMPTQPVAPVEVNAAAPTSGPKLKLRSGEHNGYSRLALDWPDVDFAVQQEGDRAVITFAKPGQLSNTFRLPPRLRNVSVKSTKDGALALELQLLPNVGVNAFRNGRTIVFDLVDGKAPPIQAAVSQATAASQDPAEPGVVPPESLSQPPVAATSNFPIPALEAAPPVSAESPATAADATPPVEIPPAIVVSKESVVAKSAEPPAPVNIEVSAAPLENGAVLSFSFPKATGLAVFKRGESLWMVFDRSGPVDLAALVKSAPVLAGLSRVETPYATALRVPNLERLGGAQAGASISGDGRNWQVRVGHQGNLRPDKIVDQRRESLTNGGASLLLQVTKPGPVVMLDDPDAGDALSVIPLTAAGTGVAEGAAWPDFRVLPSFQGVVVVRIGDRTRVEALPNGIVVTTDGRPGSPPSPTVPQPMAETEPPAVEGDAPAVVAAVPKTVSQGTPPASSASPVSAPVTVSLEGIFDLPRWRRGGEAEFSADQAALLNAISAAPERDKPQARLALAQFHFAHGRYPETIDDLALLDKLADDGSKDVLALRGAAEALLDREADALKDLNRPELSNIPEAALFRGYIAARQHDWSAAAEVFGRPLLSLDEYPKTARMLVRRAGAEALLRGGNHVGGQSFLEFIRLDMPNVQEKAYYDYLIGLQQVAGEDKESAIKTWSALAESPVDEVRARSQFDLTELQLKEAKIDARQAAKQLETLRFVWRGADFEFDLLDRLGRLYIESDQPRKGLTTLRQAATNFPKNPKAKLAAEEMTQAFHALYLGNRADKLPPLTAVALYDEFRELTPSGPDGDRMVTALADRLVKVDLLDGAAKLLESQIAKRLTGIDKAKAGTRLAAIRLLDDKPDLALEAIKNSEVPNIPPDVTGQRRRLQGRALFETGDTLKAMTLIRDDVSLDGLWLKADLAWRMREWPAAAAALDNLITAETQRLQKDDAAMQPLADLTSDPAAALVERGDAGDAATKRDALFNQVLAPLILNRAVALSLANDRPGLRMLSKAQGKQMANGPYRTAFTTLTSPSSSLADSISAAMKSVDQLGAFVDDYRERLKKESLSAPEIEKDAARPPEANPAP